MGQTYRYWLDHNNQSKVRSPFVYGAITGSNYTEVEPGPWAESSYDELEWTVVLENQPPEFEVDN